MNDVIEKIVKLRTEVEEFKCLERGKIFTSDAYENVKNAWLNLCILEDEFHDIIATIRCKKGFASTIIINVNHTESVIALNNLLAIMSNVSVMKFLEKFCDMAFNKEGIDIIYATQSFRMNRCKNDMLIYLAALQELIEKNKREIEMWLAGDKSRVYNMHT